MKGGKADRRHPPGLAGEGLPSLPPDGLLLQFQIGLTWLIAVPEADEWFAALTQAIGGPGRLPQLSHNPSAAVSFAAQRRVIAGDEAVVRR